MSHDSPTRHQRTIHTYLAENWLIVAGLAFVVVLLLVLGGVLLNRIRTRPVEVADLTGMTVEQARDELARTGLELGKQSKFATEDVAVGLITGQDPDGGDLTPVGSSVDVTVAVAPVPIAMPYVKGSDRAEAMAVLREALLIPLDFDVFGTTQPDGKVADQIPQPGRTIDTGSQVVVLVSVGDTPGGVAIPDVTGEGYITATNELQSTGLEVSYYYDNVTPAPQGQVLRQYPPPGTRVEEGTIVELTVSAFPASDSM